MRVMVDILHPAHVHFFRNFIAEMKKRGHKILVTARKKDVALELLKLYKINHIVLSKLKPGKINMVKELISRDIRFIKLAKKFRPDLTIGLMGATIATTNPFLSSKCIVCWDTEHSKFSNFIVYMLADVVINPSCYEGNLNKNPKKYIRYRGYHELAYLHPKRFRPDPSILKKLNLKGKRFFIVRFVSWQASHDSKDKGFTDKISFIRELEKYGKVLITSESKLPNELEKYKIKVSPDKLHDLLAFAALYVGESATIASEAACLGVPSIFLSTSKRGYTNEQERKYGLVYNFSDQNEAMKKAFELLKKRNLNKEWQIKRYNMLKDKIDVTGWLVNFAEDYYGRAVLNGLK